VEQLARMTSEEQVQIHHHVLSRVVDGLSRVIRGKEEFLKKLVSALVAGGHVLIEDLPGLGKTTVGKTLAALIAADEPYGATHAGQGTLGGETVAGSDVVTGSDGQDGNGSGRAGRVVFRRIQCTPDLLPYDITGVDIFDPETRGFVFSPGPLFGNVILADEINRTTPKVQSALLEVMAESQVTVGNRTHHMDALFFVIGTQNPVEIEGTYPLPLAQVDRFLMRLRMGYPDSEMELEIVRDDPSVRVMPTVEPVCSRAEILSAREAADGLYCDERLMRAVVATVAATRRHRGVEYGVSPRGSLMLVKAARAYALLHGRAYVIDQDIIDLAPAVLAHRIKLKDLRLNPESMVREEAVAELEKTRV